MDVAWCAAPESMLLCSCCSTEKEVDEEEEEAWCCVPDVCWCWCCWWAVARGERQKPWCEE